MDGDYKASDLEVNTTSPKRVSLLSQEIRSPPKAVAPSKLNIIVLHAAFPLKPVLLDTIVYVLSTSRLLNTSMTGP